MATYKSEMIEFRAGRIVLTEAQWTANTNVYPEGIIAITSDGSNAGRTKVFNGTSYWSQLAYNSGGGGGAVTSDDVTVTGTLAPGPLTVSLDTLAQNVSDQGTAITNLTQNVVTGIYEAALTQVGTAAPTAVVFVNTTGRTVTWTRDSAGVYVGTFSSNCVVANSGATIGSGTSSDAVIAPSMTQLFLLPGSVYIQTLTLAADGSTEVTMTQTDDILLSTLIRLILR